MTCCYRHFNGISHSGTVAPLHKMVDIFRITKQVTMPGRSLQLSNAQNDSALEVLRMGRLVVSSRITWLFHDLFNDALLATYVLRCCNMARICLCETGSLTGPKHMGHMKVKHGAIVVNDRREV
jgi:hypothetical protein